MLQLVPVLRHHLAALNASPKHTDQSSCNIRTHDSITRMLIASATFFRITVTGPAYCEVAETTGYTVTRPAPHTPLRTLNRVPTSLRKGACD